eukprot:scaffold152710_cov35-Tisochrysis_lutea.AAC.2
MHARSSAGNSDAPMSGSKLCPIPSTRPESRSRAQTRKSRSGGSVLAHVSAATSEERREKQTANSVIVASTPENRRVCDTMADPRTVRQTNVGGHYARGPKIRPTITLGPSIGMLGRDSDIAAQFYLRQGHP